MPGMFVVTRVPGPESDPRRDLRQQPGWDEHAAFMDALADEGFIVLGGPLGPTGLVLLIVEAPDADAVRARLAEDPWEPAQVLVTSTVQAWTPWLDGRRARAPQARVRPESGRRAAGDAAGTASDVQPRRTP
jgi:uncharacterized protein YciI